MLRRYLITQFFVLIFGGLVGPIFLAVYFGTGQDEVIRWMFYVGVLVTAADVLVALALTKFGAKSAARAAALEQNGVLALARITGITETGTRINDQPLVKLQLHVAGSGFTTFDGEKRVIASPARLANITAGKLVVLVDALTQDYQIDWERSALVNGLMPAQFAVDEGNKTYDLSGQSAPLMEILQILKANHIPLDRMIDVRSNPVLRRQIQAVLYRAAEASSTDVDHPVADSEPADTSSEVAIGERLRKLEALHRSGALTDEEYAGKRAKIIAEI